MKEGALAKLGTDDVHGLMELECSGSDGELGRCRDNFPVFHFPEGYLGGGDGAAGEDFGAGQIRRLCFVAFPKEISNSSIWSL